jgi:hypothetical protein
LRHRFVHYQPQRFLPDARIHVPLLHPHLGDTAAIIQKEERHIRYQQPRTTMPVVVLPRLLDEFRVATKHAPPLSREIIVFRTVHLRLHWAAGAGASCDADARREGAIEFAAYLATPDIHTAATHHGDGVIRTATTMTSVCTAAACLTAHLRPTHRAAHTTLPTICVAPAVAVVPRPAHELSEGVGLIEVEAALFVVQA